VVVMKSTTIFWDITRVACWKSTYLLATCFHAGILLDLFFDPEDGGDMFLQYMSGLSGDYTALNSRKQYFSILTLLHHTRKISHRVFVYRRFRNQTQER
jgi:hypothetical protein